MEGQTYLCWYNFKKSANFDSMGVAKTNNLIFLGKKNKQHSNTHNRVLSALWSQCTFHTFSRSSVAFGGGESDFFFNAIYYFIIYLFLHIEMSSAYCTVKFHAALWSQMLHGGILLDFCTYELDFFTLKIKGPCWALPLQNYFQV